MGHSPLINEMMIGGFENTEKKLIDYLRIHGVDIMEAVIRVDLDMALYFLEKGDSLLFKVQNCAQWQIISNIRRSRGRNII